MRRVFLAGIVMCLAASSAQASLFSSSASYNLANRDQASDFRSSNGVSFSATIAGFSDNGGAFLDNSAGGALTFGGTSLIGQSVIAPNPSINIETIETAGPGANQFTLTFRIFTDDGLGGTPAFAPNGTGIGGDAVGALQVDIGAFNAGLDLVERVPNPGFTINSATSDWFADGVSILANPFVLAIDPATGSGAYSNAGAGLSIRSAVSVGNGAGGLGNITTFGIDQALITVVITEVPEPATLSLLAIGGVALIRRRRM